MQQTLNGKCMQNGASGREASWIAVRCKQAQSQEKSSAMQAGAKPERWQ